ncbi:MAG: hypothetical protein WBJ84_00515 [Bacteroidales bacterium]
MKTKISGFLFIMLAAGMIFISGCKKDDPPSDPPTMKNISISADNQLITVTFSEGVYSKNDMSGSLKGESFEVIISGGVASYGGHYFVEHTEGSDEAIIKLTLNGVATGKESITIKPKTASSIYNADGVAMEASQSLSSGLFDTGILGKWCSTGTNIAPAVQATGVDSVFAEFKANKTYIIETFSAKQLITTYKGTFNQTRSKTGEIWDLALSQNSPASATHEGIFDITSGQTTTMIYEVVQVPDLAPPTAEAGFGSTAGGAHGADYVQNFIRVN